MSGLLEEAVLEVVVVCARSSVEDEEEVELVWW